MRVPEEVGRGATVTRHGCGGFSRSQISVPLNVTRLAFHGRLLQNLGPCQLIRFGKHCRHRGGTEMSIWNLSDTVDGRPIKNVTADLGQYMFAAQET